MHYATDQDIWFKVIVVDSKDHILSDLSKVVHVELIDENEQIIAYKLVPLNQGIGNSCFELDETYSSGRYLIRAYTQWNRNFGDDFNFQSYLTIYHVSSNYFDGNLVSNANTSSVHLQFFPESGQLVHGFSNKIGFKVTGTEGKGMEAKGAVFNQKGEKLVDFESNHLGMGYFNLQADTGSVYYAKLNNSNLIDGIINYPFPKVVPRGSILSVSKTAGKIRIHVRSTSIDGPIKVKASCRGFLHYLIEGPLKDGSLVYQLPSDNLPEGIFVFTLLDSNNAPVAERLFYNKSNRSWLSFSLNTGKAEYGLREKTPVEIQFSETDSIASKIDISLVVINKRHWHQGMGETIRSYFLLGSELRGEIEFPGYYFSKNNPALNKALDALMLTQGWRNYKYPATLGDTIHFAPERGLSLKGSVTYRKKDLVEAVDLSLITFGEETSFYAHHTSSTGKFQILLDDEYGKQMRVVLQAKDGQENLKNHTITLDSIHPPSISFRQVQRASRSVNVPTYQLQAHRWRVETEATYKTLYGVTELDEVVIESSRLTQEREEAIAKFGESDVVINGDAIRQKEKPWSDGLFSILLMNYPDQIGVRTFPNGFRFVEVKTGGPTLVAVDGRLLKPYEYEFVKRMSADYVESVEIIRTANAFKQKWLEVFPQSEVTQLPTIGNIIAIYTENNVGMMAYSKHTPGTLNTTIDVFSPIKEFYAPIYENPGSSDNQKPDLRSLLYWMPSIQAYTNSNLSKSFYNGDITGEYVIIAEAISSDGRIGYQEKHYEVVD